MEGISTSEVLVAPKPTSAFEAFVISSFKQLSAQITDSTNDLAESIAYVANVTLTKEEFEQRLKGLATKEDLKEFVTKANLAATEHRIKSYIDDKVVAQNVMPIIQKEDKKVNDVIDSLEENSVFSSIEAEYLKKQGPFPQLT